MEEGPMEKANGESFARTTGRTAEDEGDHDDEDEDDWADAKQIPRVTLG